MFQRLKKFFSDLFRANEQLPLIMASALILVSYDLIQWASNGQGATYSIPFMQAILIGALVVVSGLVLARWIIKWYWKGLDKYLKNDFDYHYKIHLKSNDRIWVALSFTCFLLYCFIVIVAALLS